MSIVETEQPIRLREISKFWPAMSENELSLVRRHGNIQKKGLSRQSKVSTRFTRFVNNL